MQINLENDRYRVSINTHGAELQSFYDKAAQLEYIWQANPEHWGKHAPLLFPIVGALKEDTYEVDGNQYHLTRHGFARDSEFTVRQQTTDEVTFCLESTSVTRKVYPYDFELFVTYNLCENQLRVSYFVRNTDQKELLFSIGGHPAFNVPIGQEGLFEDFELSIKTQQAVTQLPLKNNYIAYQAKIEPISFTEPIKLTHDLFENDALIFETNGPVTIALQSAKSAHKVTVSYDQFPFVGLWSTYPVTSPFVCIEPWYGLADTETTTGKFNEKLGIQKLSANEVFKDSYTILVK